VIRWLALLAVNVFAAFCYVGIKVGLEYAPPLAFGGWRALLAGVTLILVATASGQRIIPARGDVGMLCVLALTATTATYGAMFGSPALMGAGLASVLGNVQPVIILVLGAAVLHEPLTRTKVLGVLAGLTGVVMILSPALSASSRGALLGGSLALTASAGAAVGTIVVKRARLRIGLIATTGWQLAVGSVPLLAAAMVWPGTSPVRWTSTFLGLLTLLALLGTALPTTLWFWLLRGEDAGRLSTFLFLTPVLGFLIGVAAFDEPVGALQAAGVLVIGLGLLAVTRNPARPVGGPT